MNKKASSILIMIFELMAVIAIIFILVSYAKYAAESESNIKVRAASDIQMMINTLAGIPGDAVVQYPANLSKFSLALSTNKITVFETQEAESLRIYQTFNLPAGYSASGAKNNPKSICLEKKAKTITLRECLKTEVNQ